MMHFPYRERRLVMRSPNPSSHYESSVRLANAQAVSSVARQAFELGWPVLSVATVLSHSPLSANQMHTGGDGHTYIAVTCVDEQPVYPV